VKLSCLLAGGAKGRVISADGWFSDVIGAPVSVDEFNCNYGAASGRCAALERDGLRFVARDELGDVRAFRLTTHRFYVGTLFQPERRAEF
jgi:CTP synthase (UTP-ammonia lyase)